VHRATRRAEAEISERKDGERLINRVQKVEFVLLLLTARDSLARIREASTVSAECIENRVKRLLISDDCFKAQ
jgi:hypothetical protein